MLKWAVVFFVVSIVAGALGFSGIAAGAGLVSKHLFFLCLLAFLVLVVLGLMAGELLF